MAFAAVAHLVLLQRVLRSIERRCRVQRLRLRHRELWGITTNAGVEVKFDDGAVVQGDRLTAQVLRKPYEIRQAEVQRYWVETRTFSTARTSGAGGGDRRGGSSGGGRGGGCPRRSTASRTMDIPAGGCCPLLPSGTGRNTTSIPRRPWARSRRVWSATIIPCSRKFMSRTASTG